MRGIKMSKRKENSLKMTLYHLLNSYPDKFISKYDIEQYLSENKSSIRRRLYELFKLGLVERTGPYYHPRYRIVERDRNIWLNTGRNVETQVKKQK